MNRKRNMPETRGLKSALKGGSKPVQKQPSRDSRPRHSQMTDEDLLAMYDRMERLRRRRPGIIQLLPSREPMGPPLAGRESGLPPAQLAPNIYRTRDSQRASYDPETRVVREQLFRMLPRSPYDE